MNNGKGEKNPLKKKRTMNDYKKYVQQKKAPSLYSVINSSAHTV